MSAIDPSDKRRTWELTEKAGKAMGLAKAEGTMSRVRNFKVSWTRSDTVENGKRRGRIHLSVPTYMKWADDDVFELFLKKVIQMAYTEDGVIDDAVSSKTIKTTPILEYFGSEEFVMYGRQAYICNSKTVEVETDLEGPMHRAYNNLRDKGLLPPRIDLPPCFLVEKGVVNQAPSDTHIMVKAIQVPEKVLTHRTLDNTLEWIMFMQMTRMVAPFDPFDGDHDVIAETYWKLFPQERRDAAIRDMQMRGLWKPWMNKYA